LTKTFPTSMPNAAWGSGSIAHPDADLRFALELAALNEKGW